jgi:hypothetical protein
MIQLLVDQTGRPRLYYYCISLDLHWKVCPTSTVSIDQIGRPRLYYHCISMDLHWKVCSTSTVSNEFGADNLISSCRVIDKSMFQD